jgi:hypothetical protein
MPIKRQVDNIPKSIRVGPVEEMRKLDTNPVFQRLRSQVLNIQAVLERVLEHQVHQASDATLRRNLQALLAKLQKPSARQR